MKILSIELQNFKPFVRLTLPEQGVLPEGLIIIRGPNSTGKSSLFDAILWALWGHDGVDIDNDDLICFSATSCSVVLVFEVDGKVYKIKRSYDPADGMSVVLFRETPEGWRPLKEKSKSVERELHEILNLDVNQARDTLLVRQGEVARITTATPSELRTLLHKVYNIELIERISVQISNLEEDIKNRLSRLRKEYVEPEIIAGQIEEISARITNYQRRINTIQSELEQRQAEQDSLPTLETLKALDIAQRKLEAQEANIRQYEQDLKKSLERAGVLDPSPEVLNARMKQLQRQKERLQEQLSDLESRLSEIDQELGGINSTNKDLQSKISALDGARSEKTQDLICPTCSKPLTSEECEHIISDYRQTIERHQQDLARLNEERRKSQQEKSSINKEIKDIDDRIRYVERAIEHTERYEGLKTERDRLVSEMRMKMREVGAEDMASFLKMYAATSIMELTNRVSRLSSEIQSMEREIRTIRTNIESEEDFLAKKRMEMERMREIGAEIENMESISRHAQYVRTKVIPGFLADWVFQKRLIGIIRAATNRYVRDFTREQYSRIDLEPTPAKGKGGPGLILRLRDERDNATKRTSQISFGDKTAASLALRLGISRTMSSIRPTKDSPAVSPRMRCVLLDEPLGGLDRARRVAVVRSLMNDKSFKQIFLITHTEVQDWENVAVIDVSKEGASSTAVLRINADD